jgi:membrane protein
MGWGPFFTFLWDWGRAPLAFSILIVWATTLYQVAPAGRRSWLGSIPGALTAAVLWLAGSYGLRFYLLEAAGANRVLGMLGGGLILMVWVYILTFVLLLGAEVNSVLRISSMKASARGSPD